MRESTCRCVTRICAACYGRRSSGEANWEKLRLWEKFTCKFCSEFHRLRLQATRPVTYVSYVQPVTPLLSNGSIGLPFS